MFKPLLLTAIMTPLFIACGSGEELSETNIIIGENTLSYYSANDQYSQAIGKMARGCTATHIGNGYVLTADITLLRHRGVSECNSGRMSDQRKKHTHVNTRAFVMRKE